MTDVQNITQLIPGQRVGSPLIPGITMEIVELTPELAKEYLERLPERQRNMSERTVDGYASDMLEGEWYFIGDPIRFDPDGWLIDGQHRCTAVIESDRVEPVLVIRGLPADRIRVVDTGRKRTFADALRIEGYPNHMNLAAITTRVWHWEHGNFGYKSVPMVQHALYANTNPTHAQLWSTLREHPQLVEVTTHAQRIYRYTPNVPASVTGFAWWVLGKADTDKREAFFHELVQGSAKNNPEYPLNVLKRVVTRRMTAHEKPDSWVWLAYYIKAWNAWYNDQSISYLRMPTPARWDTLPKPMGLESSAA